MGSFTGVSAGSGTLMGSGVLIGSSAGSTTMAGFSLPVFIRSPWIGLELTDCWCTESIGCTESILHLLLVFLTQVQMGVLAGGPISFHQ